MPHEVGIVFHRIIDPRQKFLVMFDRLFDKPRIQTVRNHVALVRRALLTGSLSEARFAFFRCQTLTSGRNAVAKVRIVHELCPYSSISLLNSRAFARARGATGIRGLSGNASSR